MTSPLPSPSNPLPSIPSVANRLRTDTLWYRLKRQPLFWIGGGLLLILLFVAVFIPFSKGDPITIYPNGLNSLGVPAAPNAEFLAGTDTLGRDVWTRVMYGARLSLTVAFFAMITSVIIGTFIGLLGGFFGGAVDAILTRFTEIISALPTILLAITLTVVLPQRINPIDWLKFDGDLTLIRLLLAIGLVTWTRIARAVRGEVLALKEREFIEAARSLGLSNTAILCRHLLPNVLPTVIVLATLATASNILLEAGLSYLGIGRPDAPSWGSLISDGQPYLITAPWITLVPGVAIVLAVCAFNMIGNALGDALETRK
jgi:peptide/nickel transport system permease protein